MTPLLILISALTSLLPAQQSAGRFSLKKFEVIRVNPADMQRVPPSVRSIFMDPSPDAGGVDTLEEAARRAGFAPRLPTADAFPGLSAKPELGVIDPVRAQVKIGVSELSAALVDAKADGVVVPQAWEGVDISLQQASGVLVDYGDFFIAQAPPMTLNTPPGFPLDQFLEVLLRIAGINAADARNLRQKFAANPAAFFPIANRYAMDIREVKLTAGSGLLLQNADKGGELALMWSDADRSYFLTGLLTETQAIAVANSVK
jgi:hypothetical protein